MPMENGVSDGGIAPAVADEPRSATCEFTKGKDHPIINLFKRLINNDINKKKMLLTDAQIKEMLKIEFDIDTDYLYDIEIDIYLAVTKKYLKSWPQWNHFNNLVNGLLNTKDYPALNKAYLKKYIEFKNYLGKKLEITKRLAAKTVESITDNNESTESADLYLQVVCSRSHLNQLVYQVPNSHENHIFRIVESVPTQISTLKEHTLESILNWWCVSVNFKLSILFSYKREITHELEHMLINKVRTENSVKNIVLDQDLMTRTSNKRLDYCDKSIINTLLEKLLKHYTGLKMYYFIETICRTIMKDVNSLPNDVKVPAIFKQYANKYKYIRYLNASQENMKTCKRYNLQLRETLSPMYDFYITKAELINMVLPPLVEWSIKCGLCKIVFDGQMMDELISHYNIHHQNEPDWLCCNCGQSFKMIELAKQRWYHEC